MAPEGRRSWFPALVAGAPRARLRLSMGRSSRAGCLRHRDLVEMDCPLPGRPPSSWPAGTSRTPFGPLVRVVGRGRLVATPTELDSRFARRGRRSRATTRGPGSAGSATRSFPRSPGLRSIRPPSTTSCSSTSVPSTRGQASEWSPRRWRRSSSGSRASPSSSARTIGSGSSGCRRSPDRRLLAGSKSVTA